MTRQFCGLFILIFLHSTVASASIDGRVKNTTPQKRFRIVLSRGVVNTVTLPLEFKRTAVHEKEIPPKAWGFTVAPRMLTNFFLRFSSAVNDIFLFPWHTPFTDDLSPWTEAFGLPDYPWQED